MSFDLAVWDSNYVFALRRTVEVRLAVVKVLAQSGDSLYQRQATKPKPWNNRNRGRIKPPGYNRMYLYAVQ